MDYILAIDEGTSSTRAMIYSVDGEPIITNQQSFEQFYPHPGWVEHDPEEIWKKTVAAIRHVIKYPRAGNIIACGITNQRETTLIWDKKTGKCLAPAIVWQDRRTEDFCNLLGDKSELIQDITGLVPDPYFSATKLRWLLNNIDGARDLAAMERLAFGTMDSFLIWRLTGGRVHATDITNASRTMLFNIHKQEWDDELLDIFNIPKNILPDIRASDDFFGNIDVDIFGIELPITGVAGDQQAALVGQCCFDNGMAKATFGTGAFIMLNTGNKPVKSAHKLLTTVAYKINNKTTYALEGSIYQAGTTVKWLRDEMKIIKKASDTEVLANSIDSNNGVYLIPAFTGLGAPHWTSKPGAYITGLSRKTNRAHFARAALESVCFQTRDILDCMRDDAGIKINIIRVDGGMAENNWLLQYLASLCVVTVQRPASVETTIRGAAILAALGCGAIASVEDARARWHVEREFCGLVKNDEIEADYIGWQKALKIALGCC